MGIVRIQKTKGTNKQAPSGKVHPGYLLANLSETVLDVTVLATAFI